MAGVLLLSVVVKIIPFTLGHIKFVNRLTLIPKILQIDPAFKVIIISSNNDEKLIVKNIQMGANHYIIKPFNIADIKDVVFKVARMP